MHRTFLTILLLTCLPVFAADNFIRGIDRQGIDCSVSVDRENSSIGFSSNKGFCEFPIAADDLSNLDRAARNGTTLRLSGYSNWFDCQVKFVFSDDGALKRFVVKQSMPMALIFQSRTCYPTAHLL